VKGIFMSLTRVSASAGRVIDLSSLNASSTHSTPVSGDAFFTTESGSSLTQGMRSFGRLWDPICYIGTDILPTATWTAKGESKGVAISSVDVTRNGETLPAYRGVMSGVTGISVDQFRKAVMDIQGYKGGLKYVEDIRVQSDGAYYQYLDFGWGIKRHNVLTLKEEAAGAGIVRISWAKKKISDYSSLTEVAGNAVECPVNEGYWEFDSNKGTITQVVLCKTGGSIPSSMANAATSDALPGNISGMLAYTKKH
jgi:hypothetical protein